MSSPTFLNYFFPEPPAEWELEDVRRANELSKPFFVLTVACEVIGSVGAAFASLGMMVQKIRGQVVQSKLIYLEIASLALVTLGIAFYLFGKRHYQGLTEEREIELALAEFKKGIEELPVCQSQKELDDKVANDLSFTSEIAENAIKNTSEVCNTFASVYYRPTKDLQPRFRIFQHVTIDQQLDLLDLAHEKGIILHFRDYEQEFDSFDELPKPTLPRLPEKQYSAKIIQKLEDSFTCSVKFLEKHLQSLDVQKLDLINEQLRALSLKWIGFSIKEEKAFYPRVYLEDDNTIVIRGNFSDSEKKDQVIWAIESLAPHISTIKLEAEGLMFLHGRGEWNDFKNQLNVRFSGKMKFVDRLTDDPAFLPPDISDGIWQKNLPHKPTPSEIGQDAVEDMRKGKIE